MLNQKGFAPIFIILSLIVLVAISGGAYYLRSQKNVGPIQSSQPTRVPQATASVSDKTTNWKTYSSSTLGFSFSYPPELTYLYDQFGINHPDNPEGNLLLQNFDGSKPRQSQKSDFQLVIDAQKNVNQTSLESYVKDPNKIWNENNTQSFTNITLGGEPAFKGSAIQKNEKDPAIWVSHKGYILIIYLETPNSENVAWFDQILPTFKFTN